MPLGTLGATAALAGLVVMLVVAFIMRSSTAVIVTLFLVVGAALTGVVLEWTDPSPREQPSALDVTARHDELDTSV